MNDDSNEEQKLNINQKTESEDKHSKTMIEI